MKSRESLFEKPSMILAKYNYGYKHVIFALKCKFDINIQNITLSNIIICEMILKITIILIKLIRIAKYHKQYSF